MLKAIKKRVYLYLDVESDNKTSAVISFFILSLIILNVLAVILETVQSLSMRFGTLFHSFEIFSVGIFTAEYMLRLWTVTLAKKFKDPITGRVRFAFTPMALVDLMAVLPFYLPFLFAFDLRIIRMFRIFRLFRILKAGRYIGAFKSFGAAIREKKEELVVAFLTVIIALIFVSSIMYFIENRVQPEKFSSIPQAMWWGVAVLTTVGYGDVYPITTLGKILGSVIAVFGIGLVAIPAGIIFSGFVGALQKQHEAKERTKRTCPHCGKDITNLA